MFVIFNYRRFSRYSVIQNNNIGSKRQEIKQLIANLKKINPQIESNIFHSVENVNLDTIISYKQGDNKVSFLDRYDDMGKGKAIKN